MEIQRGKERMSKTVAVIERKNQPGQLEDLVNYDAALVRRLGILAMTVDEKVTAILPDLRRLSGVAVAAVPAEFAGLNPGLLPGDVIYELNNRRIASLDELRDALKDKKSGDPIALLVERFGQLIYVTARWNRRAVVARALVPNATYFSRYGNTAEFVGQTPGLRRSPWTRSSLEESGPLTTVTGRRGRRPRTRGSAPRLLQVFGYAKSMWHWALVPAGPRGHPRLIGTLGGRAPKSVPMSRDAAD